jgi:uncharacterized protein involved in exopolysaccharide biosynthesis
MNRSATLAIFVGRWWAVLLAGMVLAAGGGYAASKQITPTYEAQMQLLVGPVNTTFDLEASGTLARTYAELGHTRPVLESAIATTGARIAAKDLKDATTIESNEVTRLVSIRVQNHDPGLAARLANAIGARLVELSDRADGGRGSALDQFKNQTEIATLAEPQRTAVLTAANRVFGEIAGRLSATETATAPADPVKPSIPLVVLLAALAGLMLAGAVALVWESRSDSRPSIPRRRRRARAEEAPPVVAAPEPEDPEPAEVDPEPAVAARAEPVVHEILVGDGERRSSDG